MKRLVLLPVAALVLAFAGTAQPASGDRGLFSSEPGPLGDHVQVAATNSPDGDSYCLDAPEPMAELTELVMWACHDVGRVADSQKFAFRESRTLALALLGGMELVHVATGQCVDVEASGGVGASVLLYRCTGNANQAWRWEDSQLVSLSHGVCLDIATGIQAMGPGTSAEVLMWTCRSADHEHGNYNQVFKTLAIVPPEPQTGAAAATRNVHPEDDSIVEAGGTWVHHSIAEDLERLMADAYADGIVLKASGWRSHQRQHELRKANGCPDDGSWTHSDDENWRDWAPASACRIPTARPGRSNHESGLAIDFSIEGRAIPHQRHPAFRWLANNAHKYGLQNLASEPWHWSVDGR